jgi:hypothetical protein
MFKFELSKYKNEFLKIKQWCDGFWKYPQHIHYTLHGIEHSERIISKIAELLSYSSIKLTPIESFIFNCAAYLHDIGMQCRNKKFLKQYAEIPIENIKTRLDSTELDQIRLHHSKLSYHMILDSCKLPRNKEYPDLKLELIKPDANTYYAVALISKGHVGIIPNEIINYYVDIPDPPCRLLLLQYLLRIADALDSDTSRINRDYYKIIDWDMVKTIDKFHVLKHQYVSSIKIIGNGLIQFNYSIPTENKIHYENIRVCAEAPLKKHIKRNRSLIQKLGIPFNEIQSSLLDSNPSLTFPMENDVAECFFKKAKLITGELINDSKDSIVIPEIKFLKESTQYNSNFLISLRDKGILGNLFGKDIEDADILEASFIGPQFEDCITVWLNLEKINKSGVYKFGQSSQFEFFNYNKYKSLLIKSNLFPPISHTYYNDIFNIEVNFSRPVNQITVSEFINVLLENELNNKVMLRNIMDNIFNGLEKISVSDVKKEESINYYKLYSMYLPDFILNIEKINMVEEYLVCRESMPLAYSLSIIDKKLTVKRHGNNFSILFNFNDRRNNKSSLIRCILIPINSKIQNQLIEISDSNINVHIISNQGKLRAYGKKERIETIIEDSYASQTRYKIKHITSPKFKPFWKHFGSIIKRKTLFGFSHGNLSTENILIRIDDKNNNLNNNKNIIVLDYLYLNNGYPIIKDHASLEASIWYYVIFKYVEGLSEILDLFTRLLYVTKVLQFNKKLSEDKRIQTFSETILKIRERAYRLYKNESLINNWWPHYIELLYHELILYIDKIKNNYVENESNNPDNTIKLYLIVSILCDIINA